jgi:AcrR family transcriptional regulator
MNKSSNTKDLLLTNACKMFWSKGYSNVSVREISNATGVDVALIARYFGSKRGLFEATLENLTKIEAKDVQSSKTLIDVIVELFSNGPKDNIEASPISMVLTNSDDAEVGEIVKQVQYEYWQKGLEEIIGSKHQAAMFFGAIMGFCVAQKSLRLDGVAKVGSELYRAQLRHMLETAIQSPKK